MGTLELHVPHERFRRVVIFRHERPVPDRHPVPPKRDLHGRQTTASPPPPPPAAAPAASLLAMPRMFPSWVPPCPPGVTRVVEVVRRVVAPPRFPATPPRSSCSLRSARWPSCASLVPRDREKPRRRREKPAPRKERERLHTLSHAMKNKTKERESQKGEKLRKFLPERTKNY